MGLRDEFLKKNRIDFTHEKLSSEDAKFLKKYGFEYITCCGDEKAVKIAKGVGVNLAMPMKGFVIPHRLEDKILFCVLKLEEKETEAFIGMFMPCCDNNLQKKIEESEFEIFITGKNLGSYTEMKHFKVK